MNATPPAEGHPGAPKHRRRSFLFEAFRLASANFFTSFINVCVGIATIRIWGAAARGNIETALALPGLLSIIFDLGLGRAMPYAIGRKVAPLKALVSTTLIMWAIASVLGAGICAIYASGTAHHHAHIALDAGATAHCAVVPGAMVPVFWNVPELTPVKAIPPFWMVLAILYLPLRLFAGLTLGFCVGIERMGFFAGLMWIREPLVLLTLLGLASFACFQQPDDAWIRIMAMDFGLLFTGILGVWFIHRHAGLSLTFNRKLIAEMTHRSFTFGLGPLFLDLLQNTPSMLLTVWVFAVPKADIGNYTVGSAIAMLLMQLAYAVGHVLMSRSVNTTDHEAQSRKTLRLLRVGVIGAAGLGLCMMATAPILVPLVYGKQTLKAPWITVILVPGIVGFFALHTLSTDLIAKGKALVVAAVTGTALAINIAVCSAFSIPRFGIWGAATTTAASYILTATAMIVVYLRIAGVPAKEGLIPRMSDFPVEQVLGRLRRGIGKP